MSQTFLLQESSGTHSITIVEAGDMNINDTNIEDVIASLKNLGIIVDSDITVTHTAPPTTTVVHV